MVGVLLVAPTLFHVACPSPSPVCKRAMLGLPHLEPAYGPGPPTQHRNPAPPHPTHTRAGTDGCSDPVSLLKTAGLSPANGFISPAALTLQVAASRADASSFWLLAEDGEVVLAPEAAAPSDPRGILFAPTAWLGYIQGRNSVMAGVVLRTLDGMGSAESCARACHGYGTAAQGPSRCTAFNFCDRPAGCAYQDRNLNRERVQLRLGQCEWASAGGGHLSQKAPHAAMLEAAAQGPPCWRGTGAGQTELPLLTT
jgi:hypothetical protein